MRWLAVSLGLAGCSFSTELPNGDLPGEAGTNPDGMQVQVDARPLDGCTTFSTVVNTCNVGAYGPGMSINGNRTYDTVTHVLSDDNGNNPSTPMFRETTVGGNPITLLVADGFTIQNMARLRVVGARAFGVVSTGTISITGTLDATAGGAGARSAASCAALAGGPGTNGNDGAGGGGGGAYGGDGGVGGKGDNNGTPRDGGMKGQKTSLAATIVGGCPGGKGGNNGGATGGNGGAGGGGVFLTSAQTMTIIGIINVGGGGGLRGLATDGGGGGGGSGGQILLESMVVTITGVLAANGGGGGGGAGGSAGTDGGTGVAATSAAPAGQTTSTGGTSGTPGAAGGNHDGIQPGDANGGAGGAGGGVGFISVKSTSPPGGIVSPSTTPWP
jgi:hypothetical protein